MQKEISICVWTHKWFNFLHVFSPAKVFHDSSLRVYSAKMQKKTWFSRAKNGVLSSMVREMPMEHKHLEET